MRIHRHVRPAAERVLASYDHAEEEVDGFQFALLRTFELDIGRPVATVSIPGTNSFSDVLRDLSPWPHKTGDDLPGYGRGAFARGGRAIGDALFDFAADDDLLAIWGHSMGGAIAQQAAYRLVQLGAAWRVAGVLSFACPESFSGAAAKRFREVYASRAQSFVLGFDRVPTIVPTWWQDPAERIYIDGTDGTLRTEPRHLRELKAAWKKDGLQVFRHHRMARYAEWAAEMDTGR